MKIALDISQIIYEGTGVSRFTNGLATSIIENKKNTDEWTFFFSSLRRNLDPDLENKILNNGIRLKRYNFPPTFLHYLWNVAHVTSIDQLIGPQDWLITSDWTEPPSRYKKATIVHDLVFMRYPETLPSSIITVQTRRLRHVAKESHLIITDSHATKEDLITYFKIKPEKIHVLYPGISPTPPSTLQKDTVLKKYKLSKPFFLSVGKLEPRKNIPSLISSFLKLGRSDCELIIVGPTGWGQEKYLASPHVKFLGFVPDRELQILYKQCLGFIYPSLWEGFGYPVVEAMLHGAPVATSRTSSLGEIGKNAAILFDPKSTSSITDALQKLLTDKHLKKSLVLAGKKKASEFSWRQYYVNLRELLSNY